MSKDKIPALTEAVAGLPVRQRGLALAVLNTLRAVNRYPNAPKVLKDALKVVRTPIAKAVFDSSEYFVTRPGLIYVWPEFASRILPAYPKAIPKRGLKGVDFVDLPRNMYDSEIITEYLGGEEEARKHAFIPDQIAMAIDEQKNGESGRMLNNGYANIFYMIGVNGVLFAVYVFWNSDDRWWYVIAFKLGEGGRWYVGNRIFRNKN
jgi:hypothetical protein